MLIIEEKDFVQYLTVKKRLSKRSIKTYVIRFRIATRWHDSQKIEFSNQSIENFIFELRNKGLKNITINTYIQSLNHIDGYCKDRGLPHGFMEGIESLKKNRTQIIILSLEEIERLITTHLDYKNRNGMDNSNLDLKYLTFTWFLVLTGCRFEEAASLPVKRLDIENGRASLIDTKNGDDRFVYFDGPIKSNLSELIKNKSENDLVFTNGKGKHLIPGDYNDDLHRRAKEAGITKRVHAHLLRHSFATHFYQATHDIAMVATVIGHRDIQTTYQVYVHLADDVIKQAVRKHPLMRSYISIADRLREVENTIDSLGFKDDERFQVDIRRNDDCILIKIALRSQGAVLPTA